MDRAGIPVVRSGESPLVGRYPVNILWRFLQTIQYPDNAYYRKIYEAFSADGTVRRKEAIDEFHTEIPLSEIIDQAVALHELECSSEESVEALLRLKHLAVDFKGDMGVFLDTLSLERGIDHAVLVGDRVALMSIHAAKGLEWPIVFITGCEDKLIPCSLFGNRDEKEERRLFYVGMTRARSQLILSHVNRRALNGRVIHMSPSPFLDEIPKDLLSSLERSWKPRKRAHKQLKLF
jgi:DNA helicase-2/ATP-dependent DNA helicase PcrA